MLVSAVFPAYCDHEAFMLGPWPPRGSILQLRGLHVATVAFTSDVLLQESFFVGFHSTFDQHSFGRPSQLIYD